MDDEQFEAGEMLNDDRSNMYYGRLQEWVEEVFQQDSRPELLDAAREANRMLSKLSQERKVIQEAYSALTTAREHQAVALLANLIRQWASVSTVSSDRDMAELNKRVFDAENELEKMREEIRQLREEIARYKEIYIAAVKGRSDMRKALREAREEIRRLRAHIPAHERMEKRVLALIQAERAKDREAMEKALPFLQDRARMTSQFAPGKGSLAEEAYYAVKERLEASKKENQ